MNLRLDWCSYQAAKYAVENWHYSRRMPNSKLIKIGVWEDDKFVGVVIFGVGATNHLLTPYGLKNTEGCELVRIALREHITPVSKLVSIAMRMLQKTNPGLKLIVSFADPAQGHTGAIYQAGGWIYTGRSEDYKAPVFNGRVVHPRTLSLRVRAGTARRDNVSYVNIQGKHRYLYVLDESMRDQLLKLSKPYPKKNIASVVDRSTSVYPTEEGGSNPTQTLQSEMVHA